MTGLFPAAGDGLRRVTGCGAAAARAQDGDPQARRAAQVAGRGGAGAGGSRLRPGGEIPDGGPARAGLAAVVDLGHRNLQRGGRAGHHSAAAELAAGRGVRSLTLARAGERAGCSRGVVTHRFGSRQALPERLARATQTGFVPGLAGLPPGLDRLLRLAGGYVSALAEPGVLNRAFLLLRAEAATAPELAPIFRERDDAFRAGLRDDVRAGIADGTIRPGAAPGEVAVEIAGQLRGIGLQRLPDPPAVSIDRLHRTVTGHWRRALSARQT